MNQHGPIIQSDYDQCLRIDPICLWKFDKMLRIVSIFFIFFEFSSNINLMSFFVKHVDTNFVNFMIMVGKKNLLIAIYSFFIEYTY